MKSSTGSLFAFLTIAVTAWGCGSATDTNMTSSGPSDTTFVATAEPAGAVPVGDARTSAKDAEEIVIVGRIGGSAKPFVDGVGAFTIVDVKVPYCPDEEGCPTPWDYCCQQNQVKENIAMIKLVDEQGKLVTKDTHDLLEVKELSTVVVKGKAERDADGNLAVLANQVFVKP